MYRMSTVPHAYCTACLLHRMSTARHVYTTHAALYLLSAVLRGCSTVIQLTSIYIITPGLCTDCVEHFIRTLHLDASAASTLECRLTFRHHI